MTNNMKKDLQKVVKMFRDSRPDVKAFVYNYETHKCEETMIRSDFPKAMMTGRQISKGTATINCGSTRREENKEVAEKFMENEAFKTWCESYGIKKVLQEINSDSHYQVRVYF